ncbi:UTRA domain-containing protein [Dactylosporangium sp. CA-233914]|uniref:UTRA domain-containing protein n=1 Tax=Dactylosporangium sp. CA-233914 TaxID=3239934 RepID=UPI003D8B528D
MSYNQLASCAHIRRENWYFTDGEPVQAGITYVPVDVANTSVVASTRQLGAGGLYRRLEDLGYPMHRMREEVHARMPSPEEAAALRLPPGVPVLEVLHTSYDTKERPFEVTRFVVRADLGALDYEITVED